jgi:hypothetical protein
VPRDDDFVFALTLIFFGSEDDALLLPLEVTEAFIVTEPEAFGVQLKVATPPPPVVFSVWTLVPFAQRVTTRSAP